MLFSARKREKEGWKTVSSSSPYIYEASRSQLSCLLYHCSALDACEESGSGSALCYGDNLKVWSGGWREAENWSITTLQDRDGMSPPMNVQAALNAK